MELISQAPGAAKTSATRNEKVIAKTQSLFKWWRSISGDSRSVLVIALLAGVIAATIVITLWTASEQYVPLYGKQELYDKANILELLDQKKSEYRLDQDSGQVLVPESQLAQIRMELAALGLKMNVPQGMNGLDGKMGLGTSQFMESMNYRHALEGELALSIITIDAVRSARVHLAMPKRTLFIGRNEEKPSASVILDLQAGRGLDHQQVEAIVNLVASSVTGMKPEDVSVIDQAGRLLSLGVSEAGDRGRIAMQQVDFKRDLEARIQRQISDFIYPLVGAENFRIQVSADLDFNEVEETLETVNPNTVLSKESTREQTSGDITAMGVPGTLSNLPPVKQKSTEKKDQDTKSSVQQENTAVTKRNDYTKEYQVGRSVVHKKYELGRINNLSVAVVLNNKAAAGENGWTDAQLEKLTNSITKAIGIVESRGDQFSISGYDFIEQPATTLPELAWWQQSIMQEYLRYLVGGILGLALIFFGIRPLISHLIRLQSNQPSGRNTLALENRGIDSASENTEQTVETSDSADTVVDVTGVNADEHTPVAKRNGSEVQTTTLKPAIEVPELPAPGSEFSVQLNHLQILADKETVRVAEVLKGWVNSSEERV